MDDGTAISVRRHGNLDSPVRLLLTHGCGLAADAYRPYWSQLTWGYEVVMFDMRSHGGSGLGPLASLNIPTLVSDSLIVPDKMTEMFGAKPVAGVFHSMGAVVGLLHASQRDDFAALVLYDVPIRPTDGKPEDIEAIGQAMSRAAGRRRDTFEDPDELVAGLKNNPAFRLVPPETLDLLAASTLRRTDAGWMLRCPPAHEAQLGAWMWGFTMELPAIIGQLDIPVKVIGADPVVPFSFLPTIDMSELITVSYDFVPDLSHFLQVENPELTADLAVDYLTKCGLPPKPVRRLTRERSDRLSANHSAEEWPRV